MNISLLLTKPSDRRLKLLSTLNILDYIWKMIIGERVMHKMGLGARKPVSGGLGQSETQTSLLSYRDNQNIEILLVVSLDMVLSKKRITKELIRLR